MICRLCLKKLEPPYVDDAFPLFNSNEETRFLKFVVKYLHLELTKEDTSVSNKICANCGGQLTSFDEFYTLIEEKQKILSNSIPPKFQEGEPPPQPQQLTGDNEVFLPANEDEVPCLDSIKDELPLPLCEAVLSNDEQESEFGAINDDDDDDDDDSPSMISADRKLFNSNEYSKEESQQSNSSSDEDVPLKRLRGGTKCNQKDNKKRKTKEKQQATQRKSLNTDKEEQKESNNERAAKKKLTEDDIINEELIANFLAVKCDLCNLVETSFSELKRHFRTSHGCKGYLICCGTRFKERYRLATHIKTHIDPNAYKCSICERILKSKKYLQRHMEDKHSRDDEMKFNCDICGKKFANKNSAYRHGKVHNERTFKCELCNKSFKNKYVLEGHNQRLHGTFPNAFICDICGREYRFKPSFEKHIAEHKGLRLNTSKQCDVCGEWYSKYDRHMDKHNHIDIKCSICGKETASKAALRSHVEKVHKKRNRADTNASCTFCGKVFKYKKNLQEHITLHTDEKLYNCKFCEREFRSSANMYAHTKRAHTEEWMQAKLTRNNSKAPVVPVEQQV